MFIKRIFSSFVAAFIVITPSFGGNIISCDSFETCPDGETCSAIITGLEDTIEELQARIAELEAEIVARQNDMSGNFYTSRNLSNLRFRYANFANAELRLVDLSGTDLTGADLTGAKVYDCNLSGANLTDAILNDVDWRDTTCPDGSNSDTNGLGKCVPLP
jgi:hypothetical protein